MVETIGESEDPGQSSHFSLEFDGVSMGYFSGVSGFANEHDVVEHKVVDEKGVQQTVKAPGNLTFGAITLTRGITTDMALWEWRKQVIDGKIKEARRNGSIVMYDSALGEQSRYNFTRAWPSKWTGPDVSADDDGMAIETLEIQVDYLERVK
jgi:phage tail-like protein